MYQQQQQQQQQQHHHQHQTELQQQQYRNDYYAAAAAAIRLTATNSTAHPFSAAASLLGPLPPAPLFPATTAAAAAAVPLHPTMLPMATTATVPQQHLALPSMYQYGRMAPPILNPGMMLLPPAGVVSLNYQGRPSQPRFFDDRYNSTTNPMRPSNNPAARTATRTIRRNTSADLPGGVLSAPSRIVEALQKNQKDNGGSETTSSPLHVLSSLVAEIMQGDEESRTTVPSVHSTTSMPSTRFSLKQQDIVVHRNDVVIHNNTDISISLGCINQQLIERYKASSIHMKPMIAHKIIQLVHQRTPPGRFLRRRSPPPSSLSSLLLSSSSSKLPEQSSWTVLSNGEVFEMIVHALHTISSQDSNGDNKDDGATDDDDKC